MSRFRPHPAVLFGLTATALVAFAANSILARMALIGGSIDPVSFTVIRLASGAIVLYALTLRRSGRAPGSSGDWRGALLLALYAAPFSLAYVRLDAGTGALLLFGSVQLTMMGYAVALGNRPSSFEWIGLAGAAAGVIYLVSPGLTSPDPLGATSMVVAGIGWGGYTIAGRGAGSPLLVTSGNFRRAIVLVTPLALIAWSRLEVSPGGFWLAMTSGGLASGMGYAVWYNALGRLTLTRAALVQLAVPVIAAFGGVVLIGEMVTPRLTVASMVILGSVALGVYGRQGVHA